MKDLLRFSYYTGLGMFFRGLLLIFYLSFSSCKQQPMVQVKNTNSGPALGTSYTIIYLADGELNYQKEIDSVFAVVNQSLSTYIPTSDISKVNHGDTTLVVDHMFKEVFQLSKQVHEHTSGYFDPTVGVLVNAWGFGPGAAIKMDSMRVDSLLAYVGFDKVDLSAANTVVKENPTIYFDFNAIAKGYAIDRLGVMLAEKGITDYLVEVGGEVLAKGENQIRKTPWSVGIDDPQVAVGRAIKLLIRLSDKAMASSGNYRKFRIDSLTGEKYVHTINPKTGYTKNAKVLAATVVTDNCAKADAYATAFMAMDLEETIALLQGQQGLEAYIIYLDDTGSTKEFMTSGFEALIIQ